jgi:hypothetical protein
MGERVTDIAKLETLIADASASGGAERANYQLFIERLKMGTIASPWRDDVAAGCAIQSAMLRAPAILHCAFARCRHVLPAYLTRPGAALTSVHSPRGALKGLDPGREQCA